MEHRVKLLDDTYATEGSGVQTISYLEVPGLDECDRSGSLRSRTVFRPKLLGSCLERCICNRLQRNDCPDPLEWHDVLLEGEGGEWRRLERLGIFELHNNRLAAGESSIGSNALFAGKQRYRHAYESDPQLEYIDRGNELRAAGVDIG